MEVPGKWRCTGVTPPHSNPSASQIPSIFTDFQLDSHGLGIGLPFTAARHVNHSHGAQAVDLAMLPMRRHQGS